MSKSEKKIPSLKSQSAWLLFAKFVGYFFAFLLPLIVVRILSQEQVGTYRFIFLLIVNAAGILPLGFSMSVYYFLSRSPEDRPRTILNILLFNFMVGGIACLVLFLFPQILGIFFENDELIRLAPIAGLVIWLWIFAVFLEVVAVANREPKIASTFIILSQFTKTLFMTCAVVFFANVESILYAAMIQASLQIAILLFYLNSRFPKFWASFDLVFFRKQLVYALPFGFAGVLWILQTDIHNYFVAYKFGESDYAIYAYGCFEFPLITMLYESISSVMIPRMSELQSRGETQEIIETNIRAMNKVALTFLPIFAFLMILATPLFITLFTEKYLAGVPIFRINILLLPVYILLLDPIARAYEDLGRFLLKFRILLITGLVIALWFGIQYLDLRGIISIVVISVVLERIITFIKISKVLSLRLEHIYLLKTIGKTALAALFSGMILLGFYLLSKDSLYQFCLIAVESVLALIGTDRFIGLFGGGLYLGICLAIFVPVYYLFAHLFGVIEEEEKEYLRNLIGKYRIFSKNRQDQNP